MRVNSQRPRNTEIPGLAARRVAAGALDCVLRRQERLDEAVESDPRFSRLEARDRAFALALSRITVRHLGEVMALLERHLRRGWPPRAGALKAILACAAAQLLYMDVAGHAAVDQAVRLAREDKDALHFTALANAVLRAITREAKPAPDPLANLSPWLARRWQDNYGQEVALAMAGALGEEPPLDITAKTDPQHWAERLGGVLLPTGTIRLRQHSGPVTGLAGFEEGAWWVQDAAALLPVLAAGKVQRKSVLDLCAAPGGKTAALAARGAKVTALDRHPERLARLMHNMDRLHLKVEPIVRDLMETPLGGPYDVVLLDAPCSATGTLRRHPDVGWIKRESDIFSLAKTQSLMLGRAVEAIKDDGLLIYSTCSLEPEEGEEQIAALLKRTPWLRIEPITAAEIGGLDFLITGDGFLRSRPDMLATEGGIDGFFVARLRKIAQAGEGLRDLESDGAATERNRS